jgi:two-component system, chemotaxis family, chemotaxis protein CheY
VAGDQPPDDRRTSVLLADDDERFRSLLRGLLEDDGYAVVAEASTAADAVRLATSARPDVVLLELIMPWGPAGAATDAHPPAADRGTPVVGRAVGQEAGLQAAAAIREALPDIRIVIVSSLFDLDVQRAASALGVGYVEKVAGIDALEVAIEGTSLPAG